MSTWHLSLVLSLRLTTNSANLIPLVISKPVSFPQTERFCRVLTLLFSEQDASCLHPEPFLALASDVDEEVVVAGGSGLGEDSLVELSESVVFALSEGFDIGTEAYIAADEISRRYEVE